MDTKTPLDLLTPEQRAELVHVREVMLAHPKDIERERTPVPA